MKSLPNINQNLKIAKERILTFCQRGQKFDAYGHTDCKLILSGSLFSHSLALPYEKVPSFFVSKIALFAFGHSGIRSVPMQCWLNRFVKKWFTKHEQVLARILKPENGTQFWRQLDRPSSSSSSYLVSEVASVTRFAKFRQFGNSLQVFGNFSIVYV